MKLIRSHHLKCRGWLGLQFSFSGLILCLNSVSLILLAQPPLLTSQTGSSSSDPHLQSWFSWEETHPSKQISPCISLVWTES